MMEYGQFKATINELREQLHNGEFEYDPEYMPALGNGNFVDSQICNDQQPHLPKQNISLIGKLIPKSQKMLEAYPHATAKKQWEIRRSKRYHSDPEYKKKVLGYKRKTKSAKEAKQ